MSESTILERENLREKTLSQELREDKRNGYPLCQRKTRRL
jgi:hypothetical protein